MKKKQNLRDNTTQQTSKERNGMNHANGNRKLQPEPQPKDYEEIEY